MEFLEGLDLESLVRQHGPMPAPRVVHVLRQVCDSLEEAHARGLVHRDIKPANIHLGPVGSRQDFVKVLDFGLVKNAAAGAARSAATQSLATTEGVIIGTPAYMAPEMALGGNVDGRADLYALGCVAYYLLTGAQVFTGETVLNVITQHLQAVPVPPFGSNRAADSGEARRAGTGLPRRNQKNDRRPRDNSRGRSRRIDGMSWTEEEANRWWSQHHPAQALTSDAITL